MYYVVIVSELERLTERMDEVAEMEIAVAEATPTVEIEPTIEADPAEEIAEDPIQAEIAAKIAAVRAVPAAPSATADEQVKSFANIDGVDYSQYFEDTKEV